MSLSVVTAKSSVVQRLHNSWDLKRILTEEIEAADPELGTNMKSLRAATSKTRLDYFLTNSLFLKI